MAITHRENRGRKGYETVINSTLRLGDTGESVRLLNTMLKSLGYPVSQNLDLFDRRTLVSVKAYQNDVGLTADGVVGEKTLAKLFPNGMPEESNELNSNSEKVYITSQTNHPQLTSITTNASDIIERMPEVVPIAPQIMDETHSEVLSNPIVSETFVEIAIPQLPAEPDIAPPMPGTARPTTQPISEIEEPITPSASMPELTHSPMPMPALLPTMEHCMTNDDSPNSLPILNIGSKSEDVAFIQSRLIEMGFDELPMDGYFTPQTAAAIRAYQTMHGLKDDGIVGPQTWESLISTRCIANNHNAEDSTEIHETANPPTATLLTPNPPTASPPTSGVSFDWMPDAGATPIPPPTPSKLPTPPVASPPPKTAHDIPQDEFIDDLPKAPVSRPKLPILSSRSRGQHVKALQTYLKKLGYYNRKIHGTFDEHTLNAVKTLQIENNIMANNIVGSETWDAIYTHLSKL